MHHEMAAAVAGDVLRRAGNGAELVAARLIASGSGDTTSIQMLRRYSLGARAGCAGRGGAPHLVVEPPTM